MANLIIRKKSGGIFEHYDSQLFILSNFYVKVDVPYFQIQEIGGSQRKQYLVAEITVFDDTTGGGAETFTGFTQLMQRLKFLGYPAFSQTSGGGSGGGMPDGFQQLGTLTKLVDVLTVGFNYQWFIANNSYANTVEFSFNIPLESNDFNRKDIIVANTTNGFELISGFSSFGSNTAVQPITPIGKILLAVVDVFGNDINFDEIITNSFKTNKFYNTTLADLGVATFDLLTPAIVRAWINDLNAPNQDNEIYYYQVTNGEFFRIYVLKNRLKNQLVTDEMVELIVDESKLSDYLLNGGYIGTAQDLEDSIEAGGQLVKVTENGQTGYRLKDSNPANYGNIGQDAVDLSISTSASNTRGASGDGSHAQGDSTTASGDYAHAEGVDTVASGNSSHAEGDNTVAIGNASHAEGQVTTASGDGSHAQGNNNFARSFSEHSGGINGTDYTPQSASVFNLIDRLVNYGNGANFSNRSDAYTLFKNGMQKFFTAALSTITNATKGSVMLDENARMNIHDGFNFNQVAYTSEVLTKQNQKLTRAVSFTAENEQIYSITQSATITNPTGVAGRGYEFEVLAGTTTVGSRTFGVGSYVKVKFQGGVFVYNVFKDEKDLISKWASAVNGVEVENTVTITPTYSQLIPAGTFVAGDVFSIYTRIFSQNSKNSATNIYVYTNTIDNLNSATQLATNISAAASRVLPIERTFTIKGSTTRGLSPIGKTISDLILGAAQTAFTIDWTVDQFIIIAIGHTVADQAMRGDFFRITK